MSVREHLTQLVSVFLKVNVQMIIIHFGMYVFLFVLNVLSLLYVKYVKSLCPANLTRWHLFHRSVRLQRSVLSLLFVTFSLPSLRFLRLGCQDKTYVPRWEKFMVRSHRATTLLLLITLIRNYQYVIEQSVRSLYWWRHTSATGNNVVVLFYDLLKAFPN